MLLRGLLVLLEAVHYLVGLQEILCILNGVEEQRIN